MNLLFESAVTAFIIICLLEGWCKWGLTATCTYVVTRRIALFTMIGIIFGVLCFYLMTMITSLFTRMYVPDKLKQENTIMLLEDKVEIVWIDDSEVLRNRRKFYPFYSDGLELWENEQIEKLFIEQQKLAKRKRESEPEKNAEEGNIISRGVNIEDSNQQGSRIELAKN